MGPWQEISMKLHSGPPTHEFLADSLDAGSIHKMQEKICSGRQPASTYGSAQPGHAGISQSLLCNGTSPCVSYISGRSWGMASNRSIVFILNLSAVISSLCSYYIECQFCCRVERTSWPCIPRPVFRVMSSSSWLNISYSSFISERKSYLNKLSYAI